MKRIVGFKYIISTLLAGIALCQIPGAAYSKTPSATSGKAAYTSSYHIYLRNTSGIYEDACATSSYHEGHVYDTKGAIIGIVPPASFTIYNANNQVIGYLEPEV